MNWQKLNPWNWFQHEDAEQSSVPVQRTQTAEPSNAPLHPMLQFHQEMNRLFDDAFKHFGAPSLFGSSPLLGGNDWFKPSLDLSASEQNYCIRLEVPGLQESDLAIDLQGDVLTIKGQIKQEQEDKDRHFYRSERRYGTFRRTLALPADADSNSIDARLKDGVLSITMARKEGSGDGVKQIPINR